MLFIRQKTKKIHPLKIVNTPVSYDIRFLEINERIFDKIYDFLN